MDFARKILHKYGWKDGDGLGKYKHGIAKPLKASLKFDNAGFGADQAASDFNNHWWDRIFNEASANVNITKEGEKVKLSLKNGADNVEISTKGYSTKKLEKLKRVRKEQGEKSGYDNFLQAAILTNRGNEVASTGVIDTNDIEVSKINILTDEELFKACGGRTAHKGARHGLKLSGKLLRIEQQEAELLAEMKSKSVNFDKEKKIKINKTMKFDPADQTKQRKTNEIAPETYESCEALEAGSIKPKKKKHKNRKLKCTEFDTTTHEISVVSEKKALNKKDVKAEIGDIKILNKDSSGKKRRKAHEIFKSTEEEEFAYCSRKKNKYEC